jgi:2-dehydro-3-deoxyphosphooctonate aldolase (KDO 8-P synthase)
MKRPLELFIGPCVIEGEEFLLDVAAELKETLAPYSSELNVTFKSSFDKANRSSINSFRGPGMEKGLAILDKVKKTHGFPLITDFHHPEQAMEVASVVDVLQVPAFLCRQTDMILSGAEACAKHGSRLKVKKGQFMAPEDTSNIVDKASEFLSKDQILLTERGTSFGYRNLIVDMASFQIMKSFGVKAIHDATHCVQKPGGLGTVTGGKRDQVLTLAKAAIAAGADGIFMEVHPVPDKAKSDATTCMSLSSVKDTIETLLNIYRAV